MRTRRFVVLALLPWASSLAVASPAAAQQGTSTGWDLGGGAGVFGFLNGSSPGVVVQATRRTDPPVRFTASAWLSSPDGPLFALDAGMLLARRGPRISPYLRIGPGFVLHREAQGPGLHLGAGLLVPPGAGPGVRLEGMYHGYFPAGGIPVLSLTLALIAPRGQGVASPAAAPVASAPRRADTIATATGPLVITFVGHGTLMLRHDGKVIHVDPVSREAAYDTMPKADLVLVTHEHGDHLDPVAVAEIRREGTRVVVSRACAGRIPDAQVLENGQTLDEAGLKVEAVPAYNIVHERSPGRPYHPRGDGNGYILTFGDTRVYIAGDSENTPEMEALSNIAVAFLPMNVPPTMTPAMVADAARAFRPRILYPYHFGRTDPQALVALLAGEKDIEVRVRDMP